MPQGHGKDFQVQPEAEVFDVVEVVVDPGDRRSRVGSGSAQTVCLRPAGHSRPHEAALMIIGHQFVITATCSQHARNMRARPDQGHVAQYNVDQLRQLVDARGTQKPAEPRHP